MVIVLQKNITQENKENIRAFLRANQMHVNEIAGQEDTIFGAVGLLKVDPRMVEILPGVARVIPISKPYKMASREFKKEDTIVELQNNRGESIRIGGGKVVVIAGPCAVESREQMFEIARHVAASGAVMLRGGAFKPRTSPYAFQGLGKEGVRLLKEAGDAFGLPVVSEIVSAEHIPVMRDHIDVFQIGARNMQNFELLKRVGETGKPVVLKRGLAATIEELLMAAEYLLSSGTDNVILCERGIRTYEHATRNTLDLSAIPVLRGLTHLPVIVDPSHAVGIRDKIIPMGLASIAAGADGVIVEVHCSPEKALSDGAQSLYPEQFDKLMRGIDVLAPVVGKEVARIRKGFALAKAPGALEAAPDAAKAGKAAPASGKRLCAFMGAWGAYADQAINRFFADSVDEVNFSSFRDVFRAVSEGRADYAMVPIENSIAGSVYDNYDNFYRFEDIRIAGAITLRIEHSLLAVPGATLAGIKNVYSHPHGFPQCTAFLEKHPGWKLIECESTADAAVRVAQAKSAENAAIASELAARYNGLVELATGIESNPSNYTRFVVIAHKDDAETPGGTGAGFAFSGDTTKAAVIMITAHKPGALYECLGVFHRLGLNMTRLESRPIPGEPWRYSFYADIDVTAEGPDQGFQKSREIVDAVLSALRPKTEEIRLLGLYRERDC